MSKKLTKKSSKQWLSLVLASIAVLTPVIAAKVAPIFAEGIDQAQTIFDTSLFNIEQFRLDRRLRHSGSAEASVSSESATSSSVSSVDPCDPSLRSSAPSKPVSLHYEDLSSTEREALQMQLRKHSCPRDAEPSYRTLCEKMLHDLPPVETQQGLRNPNQ
ncbi:hypothetical protein EXS65_00735 [Candidatus Peribacteria bacterium]|nr:hypothetical protein [Candidatus Peribacteria bacterium]